MKKLKKILLPLATAILVIAISIGATLAYLKDEATADNVMTVGKVGIELLEYERINTETKDADAKVQEFTPNKPLLPAVVEKGFSYDFSESDTAHVNWEQNDDEGNVIKPNYTSPIWDPDKINNEVDKMVFVRNTGDYSAYVRIYFAFEAGNYTTKTLFDDKIHINLNDKDWKWEWIPFLASDKDGHNYFIALATYQKALAPESVTEISLSQIALDPYATNADVDAFDKTYNVLVHAQGIQSAGFENPETALDEGFGEDIPFDMTIDQGVTLYNALHYLNGDASNAANKITDKVAKVTFGLNENYSNIVNNSDYSVVLTSEEQDVPVYTYYVPNATNATKYDLYVLADSAIYTPKDSTYLFKEMSALTNVDTANMDVSRTENMTKMFYMCSSLKEIDVSNWNLKNVTQTHLMFFECKALETLDVKKWNLSSAKVLQGMFHTCSNLKSIDVSGWDVSSVTNMQSLFYNCSALTELNVSDWDVSSVTDMKWMFNGCEKIESLDLSRWNVGEVRSMGCMFQRCSGLKTVNLTGWKPESLGEMYALFNGCSSLTEIDLSPFNTANITDLQQLFKDCKVLVTINVGEGWNTTNVTDMSYMFSGCSAVTAFDLSAWNTENVEYMPYMFNDCSSWQEIDVSDWNTANVTNMSYMFSGCSAVTEFDLSAWNTGNVTNMSHMFNGCSAVTKFDFSDWNTANVTNMSYMFSDCSAVTALDLGNWNTQKLKNSEQMFAGCSNLQKIYVGVYWNTTKLSTHGKMFENCTSLVGGANTAYSSAHTDATYAHVDGGTENPGYLTHIDDKPATPEA